MSDRLSSLDGWVDTFIVGSSGFSGTWYTIEDELFCLEHDGHVHFSSLLPMLLNSSVVIPRHDLWIHLSQSSQAITFVLRALSQMPQGNRGRLGPGFGSMPDNRSSTRWWEFVSFTVNNMHWVCWKNFRIACNVQNKLKIRRPRKNSCPCLTCDTKNIVLVFQHTVTACRVTIW